MDEMKLKEGFAQGIALGRSEQVRHATAGEPEVVSVGEKQLEKPKSEKGPSGSTTIAQGQLRSFVERIERLTEEKDALQIDIREVYAEAKGNGFDTKVLRKVIAIRKKDMAERQEEEAMIELYLHALGMI